MSGCSTLPLPSLPDLSSELMRLVAQVPPDGLTTYGDLARALGSRNAAIWVSQWIRERSAMEPELASRVVDKLTAGSRPRFTGFSGPHALQRLEDWLRAAAKFVDERPLGRAPKLVAGIDVAYPAPDRATAAAVLVDVRTKTVVHELVVERPVDFPYISGFLTFRELPAMMAACESLAKQAYAPDVVMIDGQGRLHPHRGGVATGFAAATGLPTMGVAKSLLCGQVEKGGDASTGAMIQRVLVGDEHLGFSLRATPKAQPVYISVGGGLSLDEVLGITLSLFTTTRLPLPTHRADRLSKSTRRERLDPAAILSRIRQFEERIDADLA
ncbi:Endonuclease V [Caulifigura coniformis]|uniref:Endonuclease V n=1 Tax=Caulifigura coniformis TaxID=2527983 RepID=A0A517SDH3_9PLAN|nr:endonuclease V [Caulifigura coniformis]QDT54166.1 Endonuclease V [Caulifigura coniformis]